MRSSLAFVATSLSLLLSLCGATSAQQRLPQASQPQAARQVRPSAGAPQQTAPLPGRTQQPNPRRSTSPQALTQPPFRLNKLQQAFLDQVLETWELESSKITTFKCDFERWEYNAFGPAQNIPFSKDDGQLTFQKPDKGSFEITQVRRWVSQPKSADNRASAAPQGDWKEDTSVVGEHWVCDGEAVYEYRHQQKQLVVRPIPDELQGRTIADGPLPFLFGAKADALKKRYWLRILEQNNGDEIWLQVLPKFQVDAANYQAVEIILDRQKLLPKAMRVHQPDQSRHVYMFDLATASVNGRLDRLMGLFQAPRTPLGWKRVVEQAPTQAAQQPGLPRQAERPGTSIRR